MGYNIYNLTTGDGFKPVASWRMELHSEVYTVSIFGLQCENDDFSGVDVYKIAHKEGFLLGHGRNWC